MADLTCQELVELVTDYLEGALPPGEVARFEAHLAVCAGCEIHLEQVRTTIALARARGDAAEPPDVSQLLEAFRAYRR
jgi:anti-sigma factor RsiW